MNKRKSGGAYPAWLPEEIIQMLEDYKRDYSLRGIPPAHLVPINLVCDADDCWTELEYNDEFSTRLCRQCQRRINGAAPDTISDESFSAFSMSVGGEE